VWTEFGTPQGDVGELSLCLGQFLLGLSPLADVDHDPLDEQAPVVGAVRLLGAKQARVGRPAGPPPRAVSPSGADRSSRRLGAC
jgi:hypothetical protein